MKALIYVNKAKDPNGEWLNKLIYCLDKAEILSEDGMLLDLAEFSGDSTKVHLNFEKLNVDELNNKTFRIRFTVDGKLYSFGFADKSGDFGGAHGAGMVK